MAKDFSGTPERAQLACRSIAMALTARVLSLPKREDVNLPVNEQLIVELYSK